MMRIALCFSGNVRCFLELYNSHWTDYFSKVRELGEVDIFVHTFDNENRSKSDFYKSSSQKYEYKKYDRFDELRSKLNARDIIIEDESNFKEIYKNSYRNFPVYLLHGQSAKYYILIQFYSIYMSNLLREKYENSNGFRYDAVVRLRFDIRLKSFNPHDILHFRGSNSDVIFTNVSQEHTHPGGCICQTCLRNFKVGTFSNHSDSHDVDICDIYAVGSSSSMSLYSSIFNRCKDVYEPLYQSTKLRENEFKFWECDVESIDKVVDIPNHFDYTEKYNMFVPERIHRYLLKEVMVLPSKNEWIVHRY